MVASGLWMRDVCVRNFLRARRNLAAVIITAARFLRARRKQDDAILEMRIERMQKRWRAVLLMKTQQDQYRNLRNAALMIRRRWRATKIRNECGEVMQVDLQDVMKLAISDSDYWKEMIVNLCNCDNVGTFIACLNSLGHGGMSANKLVDKKHSTKDLEG